MDSTSELFYDDIAHVLQKFKIPKREPTSFNKWNDRLGKYCALSLTQCDPEATEFGEITQTRAHAVQGHLRSPILVPMSVESSYTTSY